MAFRVYFPIYDADGNLVSGAAWTSYQYSQDGGTWASFGGAPAEVNSGGVYYMDITNTVMNCDCLCLKFVPSTSGAKPAVIVLYPEETGDIRASVTQCATDVLTAAAIQDGAITAAKIATGAIDADALAADAVDEILDEVIEGTLTLRQVLRLLLSVMVGKSAGGGTATITFRDNADTKNRISATVDANNNRTAVTLDVT